MRASLFILLCLLYLCHSALRAQNPQETSCANCPQYDAFMEKGKGFLKARVFDKALNEFQAAQIAARICNCGSNAPSGYILKVFKGIQQQKEAAVAALKRAEKAEKAAKAEKVKTQVALAETEKAKKQAQDALEQVKGEQKKTQRALMKTDTALQKADKLIKAFYFYRGRFALAYGEKLGQNDFYFIDKNGDEVSKLGRWGKAEQFDSRGFAKVKKKNAEGDYLLDTLGNSYLVAFDIKDLKPETRALDLDLGEKRLRKLPTEVFQHPQLQILLLNNNAFDSLPTEIGELKNLTSLDLTYNQLRSLPPEVGALKSLSNFSLFGNQLSSLPPEVGELKNLTSLDLTHNQLSSLPSEIGELKNLTTLELGSNQLNTLPPEIGELKNLTKLYLNGNPITEERMEQIKQLLPKCDFVGFSDDALSNKYFVQKNYQKANLYIKKALEKDRLNASNWYNLSFYALFVGEPQTAIYAAKKTLELDPEELSVETNLALGYLLNNLWENAEAIYTKWKGKRFSDDEEYCDESFLQDISDLEAAGITHPDFEKVKQMFKK